MILEGCRSKYCRPQSGQGVTNAIRIDPCDSMGVCGIGVRAYGARRMWTQSGHMAWHTTHTWPSGEVTGLGLTDKDVGLLRAIVTT